MAFGGPPSKPPKMTAFWDGNGGSGSIDRGGNGGNGNGGNGNSGNGNWGSGGFNSDSNRGNVLALAYSAAMLR